MGLRDYDQAKGIDDIDWSIQSLRPGDEAEKTTDRDEAVFATGVIAVEEATNGQN